RLQAAGPRARAEASAVQFAVSLMAVTLMACWARERVHSECETASEPQVSLRLPGLARTTCSRMVARAKFSRPTMLEARQRAERTTMLEARQCADRSTMLAARQRAERPAAERA